MNSPQQSLISSRQQIDSRQQIVVHTLSLAHPVPVPVERGQSAAVAARPTRKASCGVVLGERDEALLCDLLAYGAMLPEHIHALYFPGRTRRRMNQRLSQLLNAGLVVRRPLPLGLGAGLPAAASYGLPWVYHLGGAAAQRVAARLGWNVVDVRRLVRQGSPTALAHTLEVVRLRQQAAQAVGTPDERGTCSIPTDLEFLPERLIRHAYQVRQPGGEWREEVLKADALIKFTWGGGPWRHYFVECDLGHTAASEWKTKGEIYARYQRGGLFQKRYGALHFLTLVCTTGPARRTHLQQFLARHLRPEDAGAFGLATFTDIAALGLLAPVWHVPGRDEARGLDAWMPGACDGGTRL